MSTFLFTIFLLAVVLLSIWKVKENIATVNKWADEAISELRNCHINSNIPTLRFVGATANIVKIERTGGFSRVGADRKTLTVAIFATNEYGEYFMFRKTATDVPFVKYVEPGIAKAVLKTLYVKPANQKVVY